MTQKTFLFEIITPNRIAFSQNVDTIQIPTPDGQIGIFPFHTAFFSQVAEGEVIIHIDKKSQFLSIGGGFIEFNANKATLLVTRAFHADELDEKAILQAQKEATEALKRARKGQHTTECHVRRPGGCNN